MAVVTNAAPSLESLPIATGHQTRALRSEEGMKGLGRRFGLGAGVREENTAGREFPLRWNLRYAGPIDLSQLFSHCTNWLKKETVC